MTYILPVFHAPHFSSTNILADSIPGSARFSFSCPHRVLAHSTLPLVAYKGPQRAADYTHRNKGRKKKTGGEVVVTRGWPQLTRDYSYLLSKATARHPRNARRCSASTPGDETSLQRSRRWTKCKRPKKGECRFVPEI
ncbi:hypothetical protein E2C01_096415 [Portunus trituberculatus]|uniref:Uncharacterized protein n=1 Tax=Portunus trituberculatus TaxID=210409 RepID=A0A5B7K1P0_PORTR|nr:hypothetical protein [Portunus trituberculatus]